jgi:uncharacterized membrane protein YhaH (DUF805 family)
MDQQSLFIKFLSERISRLKYFLYLFTPFFLLYLEGAIETILQNRFQIQFYNMDLEVIFYFFAVWFLWFIILSIKRLHDMNLSALYVFIPVILVLYIGAITYGIGAILGVFVSAIFLGIKKGTNGLNKFGEDPLTEVKS